MSSSGLAGRGMVVVGASAGIGRAVAVRAARVGANVVVSARREDRLAETIAEAGSGVAVRCDVTDGRDCAALVTRAAEELDAIDVVFYAAGCAPLTSMIKSGSADWQRVLETNVLGLQHIVAAAIPHMPPAAVVGVLSSETVTSPREGLGLYGASKAALEQSLRSWRIEHPELRFCCLAIGATQPTEFGAAFDMEALGPAVASWIRRGLMQEAYMETDEVARVCVDLLGAAVDNPSVAIEHAVLRSPSPVAGPAS